MNGLERFFTFFHIFSHFSASARLQKHDQFTFFHVFLQGGLQMEACKKMWSKWQFTRCYVFLQDGLQKEVCKKMWNEDQWRVFHTFLQGGLQMEVCNQKWSECQLTFLYVFLQGCLQMEVCTKMWSKGQFTFSHTFLQGGLQMEVCKKKNVKQMSIHGLSHLPARLPSNGGLRGNVKLDQNIFNLTPFFHFPANLFTNGIPSGLKQSAWAQITRCFRAQDADVRLSHEAVSRNLTVMDCHLGAAPAAFQTCL